MDKQTAVQLYSGIHLSNKNEETTDTHNMDESEMYYVKWEKLDYTRKDIQHH